MQFASKFLPVTFACTGSLLTCTKNSRSVAWGKRYVKGSRALIWKELPLDTKHEETSDSSDSGHAKRMKNRPANGAYTVQGRRYVEMHGGSDDQVRRFAAQSAWGHYRDHGGWH